MPVFKFRLQPLLEQRQRETKEAEEQLAERKRELAEAELELETLRSNESKVAAFLGQLRTSLSQAPVTSGEHLRQCKDHIRKVTGELDSAKDDVLAFESQLEQFRTRVSEASAHVEECRRQEEILVKYREKQQERFLKGEELKEANEADELGTTMYLGRREL